MPPRTMLPPNLTRHYYEARRRFIQSATGEESTPWYQLTPMDRAVVEGEMAIFREAIRAAEEEQDLLASLNAPQAAAADKPAAPETPKPAAAEENAPGDCTCPGCSAVAAFLIFIEQMGMKLEAAVRPPATNPNDFPFNLCEVTSVAFGEPGTVPPLPEETERLRQLAKDALDEWVAAGKPLEVVPGPVAPAVWTVDVTPAWLNPINLGDDPAQRRQEERVFRYFRPDRLRTFPPKV